MRFLKLMIRLHQLATLPMSSGLLDAAIPYVLLPSAQYNFTNVQMYCLAAGECSMQRNINSGLFDVESRVVGGEFFGSSFLIRSF